MKLCGRRYDTHDWVEIEVVNGRIAAVRPVPGPGPQAAELWIAPALIDLQVNGYGGQEFSDPGLTIVAVAGVAQAMAAAGVGRFYPTVTTESFAVLEHAVRTIAQACDQSPALARRMPGIHVEGPYIASADGPRGAHPRAHCRPPDWVEFQRLQEAAQGRIGLLTLSPEYAAAAAFIRRAADSGVVVAIGHTQASGPQITAAVDAGARLSTHLGNGSHPILPRHSNYIWWQMAEDRLMASLIVDGQHLPPAVVKSMVRAKTAARCILVSDLSGLAGLPPGRYASRLCDVEILDDGRLVVAGQRDILAGASRLLHVGVSNVMDFAGVDLAQAVHMATMQPAQLMGLAVTEFEVGSSAELLSFTLTKREGGAAAGGRLEPRQLILGGECVACDA